MGIISIIFSVVWKIVIAAALTFLVAGVKFFKDTKTIGKRWFLLGVWGKAIINCIVAVFDVALLMIGDSDFESIIKYTNLNISGISNDGYIEALEAKNKKFFIGVQWHPESMTHYDKNQNNLFKYFIKSCY